MYIIFHRDVPIGCVSAKLTADVDRHFPSSGPTFFNRMLRFKMIRVHDILMVFFILIVVIFMLEFALMLVFTYSMTIFV